MSEEVQQVLQAVLELRTEIKSDIATLQGVTNDIKKVLAGNEEYKTEGLVDSHKNLKKTLYGLQNEVRTYKVIGGVLYGIIGIIISILTYFSIRH